jgi:glyoxylase-like metal-dependent hydrolase (beta-lactamase superfamily II)
MRVYKLETLNLYFLSDGYFLGDAGTFFGVVPKILWQKEVKVDKKNRFKVAVNCLLIQTSQQNILIETGMGNKLNDKFKKFWGINQKKNLMDSLREINLTSDDIDIVILTHLHFDHCGWNTCYKNGKLVSTFRRAKYFVQRKEWEVARNPDEIYGKRAYLLENLLPLTKEKKLELINGSFRVTDEIECILTGGHTPGSQIIKIESNGETALFLGDLVPTIHHVKPAWNQAFDLDPLTNAYQKKKYLEQAIKNKWLLLFMHDYEILISFLDKKWQIKPILRSKEE